MIREHSTSPSPRRSFPTPQRKRNLNCLAIEIEDSTLSNTTITPPRGASSVRTFQELEESELLLDEFQLYEKEFNDRYEDKETLYKIPDLSHLEAELEETNQIVEVVKYEVATA